MSYIYNYKSPIGMITLGSEDGLSLNDLSFESPEKESIQKISKECVYKNLDIFKETADWLDIYFTGREPDFTPSVKPEGSVFRQEVWELLIHIPFGETMAYSDLAKEMAIKRGLKKMSAQAIGGAMASNPIAIIIPCHRVIGKDGSLRGYGGGLDKKAYLLENEGISVSDLMKARRK
jgi:methylated-DNA-[protein]-cysteine S-methyltransferase